MPSTQIAPDSAELAAYIKRGEDSVNGWLARFTLLLISHEVKRVEVSYSGGGDSGQIDEVMFYGALSKARQGVHTCKDGEVRKQVDAPLGSLMKQFESFCYDLLDRRGWEVNNEGSQGHFVWNLETDELTHVHETNITSVETNNYEGIEDLRDTIDPDEPRSEA